MRAPLNRRVSLERPVRSDTPGGGSETVYVVEDVVWAEISASPGGEAGALEALRTTQAQTLRIRHRDDVAPGWRAVWDGLARRITAVLDPDGRKRELILTCEAEQ